MIFLVLSGKMIFLFPKNMILHPNGKWTMTFSKKNKKKDTEIYFLQMSWKDGLFKKDRAGIWFFLYFRERWYFSTEKMIFFSRTENKRERETTFLKKYTETWYFLFDMLHAPPAKKDQRWSYPAKIHLKVIDTLDWHPIKSPSNSLYFHGDLYTDVFIYHPPAKKTQEA